MERWFGKIAIVTGASEGIGESVVSKLLEYGINVYGFSRNLKRMEKNDLTYAAKVGSFYPMKVDVTDEDEVERAVKHIVDTHGEISILINNAGVLYQTHLIDGEFEKYKKTFDVNIISLLHISQEVIKAMREAKVEGCIINMGSISGLPNVNIPGVNVYGATKRALRYISHVMNEEFIENGVNIKVCCLQPGIVDTKMIAHLPKDTYSNIMSSDHYMLPEDIAKVVKFILSVPPTVSIDEITIKPIGELW